MTKKIKLAVLFVTFAILTFVSSECIYLYKNSNQYAGLPHFLAVKYIPFLSGQQIIYLLHEGSYNIVSKTKEFGGEEYPNLNKSDLISLSENEFRSELISKFAKESLVINVPQENKKTASYFYNLGINAFENGNVKLTENFFKIASYMDPYLSYYHIELANLYLTRGRKNDSEKTINFCREYDIAVTHCNQYYENNFKQNTPEEIGFLSEKINE